MSERKSEVTRTTRETDITVRLNLDAAGDAEIDTGLGFLDHMLSSFARHGRFGLSLRARGDLEIDDHHTVEDCAITLGLAFDEALVDRRGIERFSQAFVAIDETLARVVVDVSGRGMRCVDLGITRERLGAVATENLTHFFQSFAQSSRCTIHVDVLKGANDHHRSEAAFKALALGMRRAIALTGDDSVPSTKGSL